MGRTGARPGNGTEEEGLDAGGLGALGALPGNGTDPDGDENAKPEFEDSMVCDARVARPPGSGIEPEGDEKPDENPSEGNSSKLPVGAWLEGGGNAAPGNGICPTVVCSSSEPPMSKVIDPDGLDAAGSGTRPVVVSISWLPPMSKVIDPDGREMPGKGTAAGDVVVAAWRSVTAGMMLVRPPAMA